MSRFRPIRRSTIPPALAAPLLLLLGLNAGCSPRAGAAGGAGAKDVTDVEAPPLPVEALRVGATPVTPEARALGTLFPWRVVMLQAETGGRVIAVHADAGDSRDEGDLLVEIDGSRLEKSLRLARAGVRQARVMQRRARR